MCEQSLCPSKCKVACTGLHGANRLASNSLLEGLVFAARALQPALSHLDDVRQNKPWVRSHPFTSMLAILMGWLRFSSTCLTVCLSL